ncbi:protein-export membrane protein SecD [Candidatus Giovannonibacteria bacterium RIFCSPHIGHO2_01_FULL_45_24]|uniref:Protein translocase subunit SecD n=1 Tax=Candidatus Giovannonibacteria bacterium RIFCSPLOWO2_01_FULL_46_32 TaxID=1798353 RepID=A0A1F5XGU7_9BACT|nr:MAG: protein-export membrane protein SecD [Candidatus Giovannonibacteria bacterium RIFCSPHIGHO2_01_FULL_45_24]OGF87089.1 MAG: protein-export membrane protein SecD [Candidatus Giovannonibacteria bacterium RIFCSPLOWO2_01_FULL_46_32]
MKIRVLALIILLLGVLAGLYDLPAGRQARFLPDFLRWPFRLGLDLQGGAHLVYRADISLVSSAEASEAMAGVRDVIERRVNLFGVSEPVVQTENVGGERRLIVELAGVFDIKEAIKAIGETPYLEFRELKGEGFVATNLTGRYLKRASLSFEQNLGEPQIFLEFNDEGAEIFERITEKNVGSPVAIFLDGAPISAPVVQERISGGQAQITGRFTLEEAKQLVRRFNAGALPVPITLLSQESVGASLGKDALIKSLRAAIYGTLAVMLFMILWYRLPGVISVLALGVYGAITLLLFKLIPVTLSSAGIAGFILSVGMAVDANILIFERMKEELRSGRSLDTAMAEGFRRAWTSIRDSNVSSLITAAILYYFGTSLVRGFALTLGLGILVSMFSAITASRYFLRSLPHTGTGRLTRFLFSAGLSK